MDPRNLQFFIFILVSAISIAVGYSARRTGVIREETSKKLSFHTIVWVWSAACIVSMWRLPMRWDVLWLVFMQLTIIAVAAYGMIPIARRLKMSDGSIGLLAISAGQGNLGFTLGGFLCYTLLAPSNIALAYAITYVSIMQAAAVVMIFPIARKFSPHESGDESIGKLILHTFGDLRSMHLYAAALGFALAAFRVPYPLILDQIHGKEILFYAGAVGANVGIGLRLRLGFAETRQHLSEHVLLAAAKYVLIPAVTLLLVGLMFLTPWPMEPIAVKVVIIESLMPTAIAAVLYANIFHLDARQASVMWFINTLIFMIFILPIVIWALVHFK